MRQKLTVTKPFSYAGRSRKVGETVDASSRDARILVAIRKASPFYETRVMTAAPVSPPAQKAQTVDLDSAGDEWDESLHVSTKLKNADGTWRRRPGAARTVAE